MPKRRSSEFQVRFSWKRKPQHDLMLLNEVESQNPFAFKHPKSVWDNIASQLQQSDLKMKVTGRSCKDRTLDLIAGHRRDELQSARASGISEEEATEMDKLLTSISKLEADKEKPTKLKTLYSKAGREEAEQIRENTLKDMEGASDEEITESPKEKSLDDGNKSDEDQDLDTPKRSRRSNGKRELVSFLEKKSEMEIEVRKEEIRIREREADNKRLELEILRSKMDAEIEERKKITEFLVKLASK